MRDKFLSAVSESFMLSVESDFGPMEPLEDAIVITNWCEGRSILDFGLEDTARDSKIVEFRDKPSILKSQLHKTPALDMRVISSITAQAGN